MTMTFLGRTICVSLESLNPSQSLTPGRRSISTDGLAVDNHMGRMQWGKLGLWARRGTIITLCHFDLRDENKDKKT